MEPFCDLETGYGLYLKYGASRHASRSNGNDVFNWKVDNSLEEVHIKMIVNRIDGYIAYKYFDKSKIVFKDLAILKDDSPVYLAAALLDNNPTTLKLTVGRWVE